MDMKKDDGVSNVVGEMLLLAIAVVLVSVFAVSFFGLMPGERAEVIEFSDPVFDMKTSPDEIGVKFQHIWGDFIPASDLRIIVYDGDSKDPMPNTRCGVTDIEGRIPTDPKELSKFTLDFGNYAIVWFKKPTDKKEHTFTFVLTGPRGVLETKTAKIEVKV